MLTIRDGPLFFWRERGGGGGGGEGGELKIIEKNCLQGLKRQNKLLANTKCVIVSISKLKNVCRSA